MCVVVAHYIFVVGGVSHFFPETVEMRKIATLSDTRLIGQSKNVVFSNVFQSFFIQSLACRLIFIDATAVAKNRCNILVYLLFSIFIFNAVIFYVLSRVNRSRRK